MERLQLLKTLEVMKAEILTERAKAINDKIRELIAQDESIREAAFETIKGSSNGYYKKILLKFDNAPTAEDFRQDDLLRGAVIEEIQKQNRAAFTTTYQIFESQIKDVERQILTLKM